MKRKTRRLSILPLALAAMVLVGCGSSPGPLPGGATPAIVFMTPEVRGAQLAAGEVYRSQQPEYARRDARLGVRTTPGRIATLYSRTPESRRVTRTERVRVRADEHGYRVTEEFNVRSSGGVGAHRRR